MREEFLKSGAGQFGRRRLRVILRNLPRQRAREVVLQFENHAAGAQQRIKPEKLRPPHPPRSHMGGDEVGELLADVAQRREDGSRQGGKQTFFHSS